ncbi:MAG: hypothetical protein UU12_C0001G0012 [Candidatus Woesebacteria bacterium GW2011_GWA2_40_7b]|uniref:Glycosyltransferase 2-like domain-containing protein n=1 Tax=Candidatus Woesebacteria bacterium GW2011_GWA2_40_7b TaxID=1618563 RepID=A0A0G0T338_9BACT|nr:MAG: hypothetical protein UU12_C0001G0012 [Candidatus Woesebacteria bacterium GW2011_GWA2_40_7b]
MTNFVSIITVNFNGKRFLKDFLNSTFIQDCPKENYEVIVVDNGSTDDSIIYIEKNFPKVRIIKSEKNLGFGLGNNLGMKHAKGDLFLLANNDTILNIDTVTSLVDLFKKRGSRVGAIGAKLVLVDFYLPIMIEEAFFSSYASHETAKPYTPDPFIISHDSGSLITEKVFIPLNHEINHGVKINLRIKPFRRNDFKIYIGEDVVFKGHLDSLIKDFNIDLDLSKEQVAKYQKNLIQNAGNFYFRDGSGRDRGAIIAASRQFYEEDDGQYDEEEIVPAFCGAGVLLNKKALQDVGYFDKNFFMYYEDSDLSFRLREKGWRVIYNPKSVIRHIHAGSSKEWSDFFVFHAERGRLLFVSKHWPRLKALQLLFKYVIRDTFGVLVYNLLKRNWEKIKKRLVVRLRGCASVLFPFFIGLFKTNRIKYNEVKSLM